MIDIIALLVSLYLQTSDVRQGEQMQSVVFVLLITSTVACSSMPLLSAPKPLFPLLLYSLSSHLQKESELKPQLKGSVEENMFRILLSAPKVKICIISHSCIWLSKWNTGSGGIEPVHTSS